MEEEKLGQKPIFPSLGYGIGMSQRLFIATNLTAARIASGKVINNIPETIKMHYSIADELLKQENE